MRKISASEISTYLFCERAWWYQHQGIESHNLKELASGSELHHQHSRAVVSSGLLKLAAYLALLIAIILFSVHLVLQIL
jgi:CRISPR/Cas system-associated exonuclease Cas4 (RecB family)